MLWPVASLCPALPVSALPNVEGWRWPARFLLSSQRPAPACLPRAHCLTLPQSSQHRLFIANLELGPDWLPPLWSHTQSQKLYIKSHAKTQPAVTKIPLHWEISWWSRLFTVSCWLIAHSRGSWLPPATDVRCEAPKLLLTFRGFYNLILTKPIRETGRQWSSLSQLILYVTVAGDHKWLVSR